LCGRRLPCVAIKAMISRLSPFTVASVQHTRGCMLVGVTENVQFDRLVFRYNFFSIIFLSFFQIVKCRTYLVRQIFGIIEKYL